MMRVSIYFPLSEVTGTFVVGALTHPSLRLSAQKHYPKIYNAMQLSQILNNFSSHKYPVRANLRFFFSYEMLSFCHKSQYFWMTFVNA